jgi:uncharacterized protein YjbI with pentapeptide repeats
MNKYLTCVLLILWSFGAAFGLESGDNQDQSADRELCSSEHGLSSTEYIIVRGQPVQLEDGLVLRGESLLGIKINNRTLADVDFFGAKLDNADLSQTRFRNCSFRGAHLTGVKTEGATFDGCDFTDAWFEDNSMLKITREQFLSSWNFKMNRVLVSFCAPPCPMQNYTNNIDYSDFSFREVVNLDAEGGTFTDVNFTQCSFCNMTKDQLASTWNYKKRDLDSLSLNNTKDEKISLSGLDLSNFRIRRLSLTNYDVTDVDFTDAMIWETLEFISCSGVTKEQLQSTWNWKTGRFDFCLLSTELDWSNTDFSGFTFCRESRLSGNVTGADFTDAKFLTVLSPKFTTKSSALEHCQGLTLEQVKSTWNYKTGNMEGVVLPEEVQRQLDAETTAAPE